jgi:ribulose 1,5-bisphosphate carboxylase large subunit-like protein
MLYLRMMQCVDDACVRVGGGVPGHQERARPGKAPMRGATCLAVPVR